MVFSGDAFNPSMLSTITKARALNGLPPGVITRKKIGLPRCPQNPLGQRCVCYSEQATHTARYARAG